MKRFFINLNSREKAVIIALLLIFTAGIIIKYSGWNKPERFDYSETDRQFGEKTKADFNRLKEQRLNELQDMRSNEIKKLADSLLIDGDKNNSNNNIHNNNSSKNAVAAVMSQSTEKFAHKK